jgi:hypothetical protein
VWLVLISGCASNQATSADSIVIQEQLDHYQFSVPKSALLMSLPKQDLIIHSNNKGGATANPRYFYLQNASGSTIFSGWFEPEEKYQALSTSFKQEMAGLKKSGFGDPQGVESTELGQWQVIVYHFSIPSGSSVHLRASYLAAGTWIDLHISISSAQPLLQSKADLLDMLRSISIVEKTFQS